MKLVFIIVIIIFILWCWNFLWNHPAYDKVAYHEIEPFCKSGDLILFHGLDSINAMYIGSYYTHIGMIYRSSPTDRPLLFEAWNSSEEVLYPKEISHGIAISDLENRIQSYRGYVFYKPLAHELTLKQNALLYSFMQWAYNNMHYNTRVIKNGVKKLLLNDMLRRGTNCGELMYITMITIGLLAEMRINENRKHHLRWVCSLENTDDGNSYMPIKYIWQNYFVLPSTKNEN